jgi:hypothetical protein
MSDQSKARTVSTGSSKPTAPGFDSLAGLHRSKGEEAYDLTQIPTTLASKTHVVLENYIN